MNRERRSLLLLSVTLFQVLIGFGIIMPIMPVVARQLGGGSIEMGLVSTLWAGAQFLTAAWWGNLSDRIGRRKVLLIGLAGYVLAFIAMSQARHMWLLLGARLLGGFLSAGAIPAAQAYAADITTKERRGPVLAAMAAAQNLGFICGPAIGTLLAPLGPTWAFLAAAGGALINWVATYFLLPEPPRAESSIGLGRRAAGMGAVVSALRGADAIFYVLAFVATFGGSQMFSMLGFFLVDRFHYGARETGIAFAVEGLSAAVLQVGALGPALRYLGEARTVQLALVAGMAGFGMLVLAPGLWTVLAGLVLVAVASDCMRPTVAGMLSRRTRLEQGLAMGLQTAFDALGRTVGPIWAGMFYMFGPRVPFSLLVLVYIGFLLTSGRALAERGAPPTASAG